MESRASKIQVTPADLQRIDEFIDKYTDELAPGTPFKRTSPSNESPVGTLETKDFFAIARIIQETGELVREMILKVPEAENFSEPFGPEKRALDVEPARITVPAEIKIAIRQFIYKELTSGVLVGFFIPSTLRNFGQYSIRATTQDSSQRTVMGKDAISILPNNAKGKDNDKETLYMRGLGEALQVSNEPFPKISETEITLLRAEIHKAYRKNSSNQPR